MVNSWTLRFMGKNYILDMNTLDNLIGDGEELFDVIYNNNKESDYGEPEDIFDSIGMQLISDYFYDNVDDPEELTDMDEYEIMEEFELPDIIIFTNGEDEYIFDVEIGVKLFLYNLD